jgi:hypothetical protein
MSNFDSSNSSTDRSGRSQAERKQVQLLSDLSKSIDTQHHNTSLMHEFGSAFEAPASVSTNSSGVGTVGSAPSPARADHQHGAEVPTWIYPVLINGWTNYGGGWEGARYCKLGGVVHIQGLITGGVIPAIAFYMQAGYIPRWSQMFATPNNGGINRFDVNNDGSITVGGGANVWYSITVSFVPG